MSDILRQMVITYKVDPTQKSQKYSPTTSIKGHLIIDVPPNIISVGRVYVEIQQVEGRPFSPPRIEFIQADGTINLRQRMSQAGNSFYQIYVCLLRCILTQSQEKYLLKCTMTQPQVMEIK